MSVIFPRFYFVSNLCLVLRLYRSTFTIRMGIEHFGSGLTCNNILHSEMVEDMLVTTQHPYVILRVPSTSLILGLCILK